METASPETGLHCTQCGGELHPDEGQIFLTCPFCSSTIYLDKSQVVFHWQLAPTLDESKARAALSAWMAGNETVKDLDKKASLTGSSFEYFPVWYFMRRTPGGKEEILIEPAAATSVSEIRSLRLMAGDLRKYDVALDAQSQAPTVPLQAALDWMKEGEIPETEIIEKSLVHIPVYTFKYLFQGNAYTALVEAATGSVLANIYPAKAEAPYLLVGGLTAMVFICLAMIPVFSGLFGGADSALSGLGLCAGIGCLSAPILFGLAVWVAAKV